MMTIARNALLFSLVLTAACNDKRSEAKLDPQPAPTDPPSALTLAHEAYLAGDWVEMGERLKDVIVDPRTGELARDNAFALLESANEATRGQLPARTALPKDVNAIMLGVLNGANPSGPHRMVTLRVRVPTGRGAHVSDVRLVKLPSEPILALTDKLGTMRVEHDAAGFEDVKVEVRNLETLPVRGAFGIHVAFDDAPSIDTFVLADKLVASALPEVLSPSPSEVLKEEAPLISWRPFRSPEHASWEPRALWTGISRNDGNEVAWDLYKWQPDELASARASKLAPDSYWLTLLYTEERSFGGVRISRTAETGRPFRIAR